MGLQDPDQEDLELRYAKAAILLANQHLDMVVLFDEMDKAGKMAIDGLLSLLSKSSGETFEFQGGKVKLRDDFYIMATSNDRGVGTDQKRGEDQPQTAMNTFLGDRTEQIKVGDLPVKDALQVTAVWLSDDHGRLMVSPKEQLEMIHVVSYLMPKLRAADVSMAVSNRLLKTICSRLVTYKSGAEGKVYSRAINSTGQHISVMEAVRVSLLEMKGMSLTDSDQATVSEMLGIERTVLQDVSQPLPSTDTQLDELFNTLSEAVTLKQGAEEDKTQRATKRADLLDSIWRQPLFAAIGALRGEVVELEEKIPTGLHRTVAHLFTPEVQEALVKARLPIKTRVKGQVSGAYLSPTARGLERTLAFTNPATGVEVALGAEMVNEASSYEGASVIAADQLGNVAVLEKEGKVVMTVGSTEVTPLAIGSKVTSDELKAMVDPRTRYVIFKGETGLMMKLNGGSLNQEVALTRESTADEKIEDFTADGNHVLTRDGQGRYFVYDMTRPQQGVVRYLIPELPAEAKRMVFLGDTLLGAVDAQTKLLNQGGVPLIFQV